MPDYHKWIDALACSKLREISRRKLAATALVLGLAAGAIAWINHCAAEQRACAIQARDQMHAWLEGRRIDDLQLTFDELRSMYQQRYEECL